MYSAKQLKLIEDMWVDLYPVAVIAAELDKNPAAIISVMKKRMKLPDRDRFLVRMLNYYGRDLLKYGNTREQIRAGLKQESERRRIEKVIGRADRQQVALDYLRYELDHGHDKKKAIKRAYNRDATISRIRKVVKMSNTEVTAIVRGR